MTLPDTPWLSDWRKYADETDMNPKAKRTVDVAIRQVSQSWEQKHADVYRAQAELRFSTRDEKVVGTCDQMRDKLAAIRRDVRAGRLPSKEALAQIRTMQGQYQQAMDLHETLIEQEDTMRALAEMTPDDYQRQFVDKYPVLRTTQPTLAGVVSQMTEVPSGGGSRQDNPNFVRTDDAPSADDLRV
ncbi:hypothetical protein [Actinoplanes auranticolor]|uniref:Uncharacterized protein n=1 Tax=Actinoplanes auranticolor TaxID=47988 RepID=A0A919W350_9ACTN|nr:hypothetical protein [Actinoplanes auranticolor]GIM78043.1 hypothetical protein Aau02nite_78960 [Actinoplanes auranticolor]